MQYTQVNHQASMREGVNDVSPVVSNVLHASGQSLDSSILEYMEPRFGHDFSQVRVHISDKAAESAQTVHARAYTVGKNIVFNRGEYAPESKKGKRLLAHELTHVVQQNHGHTGLRKNELQLNPANDGYEQEADQIAKNIVNNNAQVTRSITPILPCLQRDAVETMPQPTTPQPKCGPDATDWFVGQVNSARRNPPVLAIRSKMARADALARRYGTTAMAVAEGGVTARVLAEEVKLSALSQIDPRLSPPARNRTINAQLATGAAVGASATVRLAPIPMLGSLDPRHIDTPVILGLINSAASDWAALVTHGAPYDFKAHVLNHPRSRSRRCPDQGCVPKEVGTVTLCPGSVAANCYESDLPGNLFYALIGKYVGFSRNTLQLGSQLAELTDVTPRPARPRITWDTPDDTAAIDLGYRLPLPLTRAALCLAVPPARSSLSLPRTSCADCLDVI